MRIVGLLAWYDEPEDWLDGSIRSHAEAGITDLICIDGAYELYPDGKRRSPRSQHEAIKQAASDVGIKPRICGPPALWSGEVAKRSFMFRKAEQITAPSDWYFVMDADHFPLSGPTDLQAVLADTDFDAAAVSLIEPHPQIETSRVPFRALFRAIRGLYVKTNHYTYMTPDGRCLWGQEDRVEALDLQSLQILHYTHFRQDTRRTEKRAFYAARNTSKKEASPCHACGKPSVGMVPINWRIDPRGLIDPKSGQGRLTADWVWACDHHEPLAHQAARRVFIKHGMHYDTATCNIQNVGLNRA